MEQTVNTDTTEAPLVTAIYWYRYYTTAWCTLLRLDGETLTMKTKKRVVWSVPISQTTCHFTVFGTMKISYNGKVYSFLATTGGIHGSFNQQQLAEVSEADAVRALERQSSSSIGVGAAVGGAQVGGAAGSVVGLAGAVMALEARADAVEDLFGQWEKVYQRKGLLRKSKSIKSMRLIIYVLFALALLVGIGLAFIAASTGVLD